MNELNRSDNPILYWLSKIGDFCALSLLWLLLCLPVVTFIPASIALYDSIAHCLYGTEEGPVRRFFLTLKRELLRGILLSLLWLAIGGALAYGYSILAQMGQLDPMMSAYCAVYVFTMVVPLGILAWLIPVESRFEHSFFGLFRAAAVYAISHLPTTVLLVVILLLAVVLTAFVLPLIILIPAVTVAVQCCFVERVFRKYIPQEEETDHDDTV